MTDKPWTPNELINLAKLEELIIAGIKRTDWTGIPLTAFDKQIIGMAVTATCWQLTREEYKLDE